MPVETVFIDHASRRWLGQSVFPRRDFPILVHIQTCAAVHRFVDFGLDHGHRHTGQVKYSASGSNTCRKRSAGPSAYAKIESNVPVLSANESMGTPSRLSSVT